MRILSFLILFALMIRPAMAFDRLSDPFDPSELNFQEKRILQAMLVVEGTYTARLDGAWGRGSQSALQKAVNAKFGNGPVTWERMAMLAQSAKQDMKKSRWSPVYVERTNTSYLVPGNAVDPTIASTAGQFVTDDKTLAVRSFVSSNNQTDLTHKQVMTRAAAPNRMYRVNKLNLRITSGKLRDGRHVYLRSEKVQGGFVNTIVEWAETRAPQAQLIISSIKQGRQENLDFTAGWLRRAVARLDKPRKPPKKADKPAKPVADPEPVTKLKLRGIGIYINNTDMIVAQAAVDACASGLTLADGTALEQIERLPVLDMVVMTSPNRSRHWMRVFDGDLPQDKDLTAIFMPNRNWQANQVGAKNARILGGFSFGEGKTQYITLLPGTSPYRGAPLLNSQREMVGILLGAPDLTALTGSRGRARRDFSVAISTKPLSPMLHRRGVVHQRETTKASAEATQPEKALVAVACQG